MESYQPRQRQLFDFDWLFIKSDPARSQASDFDDADWRRLNLPHDWSIEGPWSEDSPAGSDGGYAPLGLGWYRKHFHLPAAWSGKRVFADFDGVFNHSDVWVNGQKVSHNDNGYLGFQSDLTPWLKFDHENVVAVRVDNLVQAARWYTGSGIYRHVWLTATESLHVGQWGTYITTPRVGDDEASVRIETTLRNDSDEPRTCALVTHLVGPDGGPAGSAETAAQVAAWSQATVTQEILVAHPQRWDLAVPALYHALTEVRVGVELLDRYESPFGIRTIEFNVRDGFKLNGRRVLIKGLNLHGDWGALGTASLDRAQERRLEIVKDMGCNAVRLSHHPHAPEILDMCDRMGLLVFPELTDKWYGYQLDGTGWNEDLASFLRRDRNHPSIFIWSVGNEIQPHQMMHEGALLYQRMAAFVHEIEPTRPVTAALHPQRQANGDWQGTLPEMARYMDVLTMNYSAANYEQDHLAYPDKVLLAGEVHVHEVYDLTVPREAGDSSGQAWFAVEDYATGEYFPHVAGQFVWAGIDYLGEVRRWRWPGKGNDKNLANTCGFRKPFSYYHQSLYSAQPLVRIAVAPPDFEANLREYAGRMWNGLYSHWNWQGQGPDTLRAFTFSNAECVELLLNGRSLGQKSPRDFAERIITWDVPNEPGTLAAVATNAGRVVAVHELVTAGNAVRLELIPDRSPLLATGQDLAHVEVRAVDRHGVINPHCQSTAVCTISGPGTIAGVDNGDLYSPEPFRARQRELRDGRCLVIVQSKREPGVVRLAARGGGLGTTTIEIPVLAAV